MLANTSIHGDGAFAKASLQIFPGEEPTRDALVDWLEDAAPSLRRSGYGAAMARRNPPHLIAMSELANMPDIPELTDEQREEAGAVEAAKHDLLVAKVAREKSTAAKQFLAGSQDHHTRLASILESSLRRLRMRLFV